MQSRSRTHTASTLWGPWAHQLAEPYVVRFIVTGGSCRPATWSDPGVPCELAVAVSPDFDTQLLASDPTTRVHDNHRRIQWFLMAVLMSGVPEATLVSGTSKEFEQKKVSLYTVAPLL